MAKRRPATADSAVKRSVTIRRDLDERAHDLVGERGFSALMNEALELALQARGFGEIVAEYEAKHGVISDAAMDKALRSGLTRGKLRAK